MYIHCKTRVNQCHTNSVEKNIFCVHITGDSHQCASFVDLSCKTNICPLRNDWLDENSVCKILREKIDFSKFSQFRVLNRDFHFLVVPLLIFSQYHREINENTFDLSGNGFVSSFQQKMFSAAFFLFLLENFSPPLADIVSID